MLLEIIKERFGFPVRKQIRHFLWIFGRQKGIGQGFN
jgi:hypothetical protein